MNEKYFEAEIIISNQKEKKRVQANSKVEAIERAKELYGGKVIKIREIPPPIFKSDFSLTKELFTQKIPLEAQIVAIRQIAVMANAGLPFTSILKETISSTADKRLKEILTKSLSDINAGMSFSESLRHHESELGRLTISMTELGEKTGAMAESLNSLASILEEIQENRVKLKKALRYPFAVVGAMCIAFVALIMIVVPKFKAVFDKFKADLPLPTKILLGAEKFFADYGIIALLILTTLFIVVYRAYKTSPDIKTLIDKWTLKLPIVGETVKTGLLSRFTVVFKELNKAGLPIVEALEISQRSIENGYVKKKFSQSIITVQKGMSLTEAFKEAGMYENMTMQMLRAGEQSGSLGDMLDKISDYYSKKFQSKMDNISASIEPVLITMLAGLVLLLALGIFMPMWDMAKAIR